MPDADDFDVEYLRALMKGGGSQEPVQPPAQPVRPGTRARAKKSAGPAAPAKRTGKTAAGKKSGKRR